MIIVVVTMKNPREKIETLLKATPEQVQSLPKDLIDFYNYYNGKEIDNELIKKVVNIYKSSFQRNILEAFLMGESIDKISSTLNIPVEVITKFKEICFNTDVFENKVEKMEYISYLKSQLGSVSKDEIEAEAWFVNLKLLAFSGWVDYLNWLFGDYDKFISREGIKELIVKILCDSTILAKESARNEDFEDSRRWVKLSVSLIDEFNKLSSLEDVSESEYKTIAEKIRRKASSSSPKLLTDEEINKIKNGSIDG